MNQHEGNQGHSTILVCPNCEFENPTAHKFCQSCGTALETWWALIVNLQKTTTASAAATVSVATPESDEIALSPEPETSPNRSFAGCSLDSHQRYQVHASDRASLQDWLDRDPASTESLKLRVWDSQPAEKPFLEALLEQQADIFDEIEASGDVARLSAASDFWDRIGVPAIALPYLILQEALSPSVPVVRDAWQHEGKAIVLLEDRSNWAFLADFWEKPYLPTLQLLCWLDEMAKLWQGFTTARCCQSLLAMDNLRLDEDQSLCVQQLYLDPPDRELGPQDLGKLWQQLFSQSDRTLYGPLAQFIVGVSNGDFSTIEAVRDRLSEIARAQDPSSSPPAETEVEEDFTPEDTTFAAEAEDPGDTASIVYQSVSDDLPTVVLPMQILSLRDAGYTDIGRQREHNEDYFGIETQIEKQENVLGKTLKARGLYIVCDGMGGHAAGEVASALAVETLQEYFKTHWTEPEALPDRETILQGVLAANQKIYDINQHNERSGSGRMGTTLVMALVQDTHLAIAHVGDSRIYRVTRKRGIEQLTIDHEVGQREIKRGVEPADAYARPDAYQLTQALGPRNSKFVKPDINFFDLNEDTLLLLCSDGLSDGNFLENHSQTHLVPLISSKANLEQGLIELIDRANQQSGHDNITGLIARVKVRPNTDQPMF